MNNLKKDIEIELEKVNERISSKKKLLSTYPDDKGLILSLESFKKRKNELLFQLEQCHEKTIHQRLNDVQKFILENEQLQKKFPEQKNTLKVTLNGLRKLQEEMFGELNEYYLKPMTLRNIETIKLELSDVNHILSNINELLIEDPNSTTLKLDLKTFQYRANQIKEELIIAFSDEKRVHDYINHTESGKKSSNKQKLENIQRLILENKELQEYFPKNETLSISLKSFKRIENTIFDELKREKSSENIEIYETILENDEFNGTIPSEILGNFLIDNQNTINAFAKNISNGDEPINTQLDFYASASGSFKILFTNKQRVLMDINKADTIINRSLKKMSELNSCKNKDVKYIIDKFGRDPVRQYKKLVATLSTKNLNVEFKKIYKNNEKSIFRLENKDSKKIYALLDKEPGSDTDLLDLSGIVKAIDLTENHHFKIKTEINSKNKNFSVSFKKEFDDLLKDKLDRFIRVKVEKITNFQKVDRNTQNKYNLVEILD
ncbi:MAG: hypothetical protein LBR15_07235 [Methanobrevibacter sp.]|jgi:regulation of enolase protein 1 (concanavalin A-like superfamily)|nr:hypothetical protein [Candidatus Methanovirga australis]